MPYDSSTFDAGDETPVSVLDRKLAITQFPDRFAKDKRELRKSLRRIAPQILNRSADCRDAMPMLKLGRYGEMRSDKGSLRHDANFLEFDGIECDHDAGTVSIAQAVEWSTAAGIACLIHATGRHTPEHPRWRALIPVSRTLPPSERTLMCARAQGVMRGALAPETFNLSQGWYYGRVKGNPHYEVRLIDGIAIDLADHLDAGAIGRGGTAQPELLAPTATPAQPTAPDPDDDDDLRDEPNWERVKSALDAIPAATRDDRERCWLRVGMVLHHESSGSAEGFRLWDEWSQAGSKYDPDDQRRVWQSFKFGTRKLVRIGSLYRLAQDNGWQPNQQARAAGLQASKSGTVLSNLRNALHLLRTDPALSGLLAFDQMQCSPMLMRPIPRYPADALDTARPSIPRPVEDGDVTALLDYLQGAGLTALGFDVLHRAVDLRAAEKPFHPVRDYLNSLAWDGSPRLGGWLTSYLRAEATPYTAGVGRMFLLSMVARVFKPGCKADYMLILEGDQGAEKSAACSILGGPWFSDSLPDLAGSDQVRLSMHLRGKWLIEPAELSAMSRAETATLKAFITRQVESFTPKYGRREVTEARQCVFLGTTNPDGNGYLKDSTGGRRFWPVQVGDALDVDGLARDRDQLFAEAVAAFRAGEHWWPDRDFERQHIAPQQEERREADAWQEPISQWLGDQAGLPVKVAEVAQYALRIEAERLTPPVQGRIARCLKQAGWIQRRTMAGRWWEPAAQSAMTRDMTRHDTANDAAPCHEENGNINELSANDTDDTVNPQKDQTEKTELANLANRLANPANGAVTAPTMQITASSASCRVMAGSSAAPKSTISGV